MNPNTQELRKLWRTSLILDNFLKAVTSSEFQVACQLGIFLIAAALVSLMTIRLLISLVIMSTERMKKQWLAQPPEGADQSLTARLFGEFGSHLHHKRY